MEFNQLQHGGSYEVVSIDTGELHRMTVTRKNYYGIQFRMDDRDGYWFMSKTVFKQYFEIIEK
jgi:hypothetical protein